VYGIKRHIRYDSDRDNKFSDEIMAVPGCENLDHCIQCGTCSGTCPLSIYMDLTPRKVINLTRAGFRDDVLKCHTIWLCSSCYACVCQCPREIGITDIMYALKQRAMREGKYPKGMPTPVLARVFYNTVSSRGRISEIRLVIAFLSRAHWQRLIGMWKVGLNLMTSKRFSLKAEKMERPAELQSVLSVINSPNGGIRK